MTRSLPVFISFLLVFSSILMVSSHTSGSGSIPLPSASDFEGGSGTESDPYQISNVSQLQNMSSDLDAHYILVNDIDASATRTWNWNGSSYNGFNPIGDHTNPFAGTLDGRNCTVSNLYINRTSTDYLGFFGEISNGVVDNVGLLDCNVSGSGYVGGFVGYNTHGIITNCFSTGNISGSGDLVGGFVGSNAYRIYNSHASGCVVGTANKVGGFVGMHLVAGGVLQECYATAFVSGSMRVGGFAGHLVGINPCMFSNCYATGGVKGTDNVGGFAGEIEQLINWELSIFDCFATGNVNGTNSIGGFVGRNNPNGGTSTVIKLSKCHATGNVTGSLDVGGFVGYNFATGVQKVIITDCYASGNVNGKDSNSVGGLGGFVGSAHTKGDISNCYSTGNVKGKGSGIGGFGGSFMSPVTRCYSNGNAQGTSNSVGGFAGGTSDVITNCYSTGNATATGGNVGGFVGLKMLEGSITNCFSIGSAIGASFVGGFVGKNNGGAPSNCFWDNVTSGWTTSAGGSGKNTTEMKQRSTFTNWDFENIWNIREGKRYPWLGMFNFTYTIRTLDDLDHIRYDKAGDYIVANDIDASETKNWNNGAGFFPIGDSPTRFGGTLHGNNFTISGLFINRPSTNGVGLFGFTTAGCMIKYISLNDVNITGHSYVGALVGANDYSTTVTDSNSSGVVKGNNEVGGLFGRSYGLVERCSSTVEVEASNQAGGLVGVNLDGTVNNCFASGNVTGFSYLGGLVGRNRRISSPPTVTDSYATGHVSPGSSGGLVGLNDAGSSVTGCFYDNITTGHSSGSPGTPKNTTDMMKRETFSSAGWDLENVWNIKDGSSYPFFGRFNVSFMIFDLEDLHNMRYDKSGDYKLANDIDASATREWFWNGSAYNGFDPIGDDSNPFSGSFDGNDHTIDGLYINLTTTTFVGLFGYISSTSSVSNTTLKDVNITGKQYTGGLVGWNDGRIDRSNLMGEIFSETNCGGISGYNRGIIENCTTSGNVTGNGQTGGIAGDSEKLIKNCISTANVSSPVRPGGVVGYISGGSIVTNCTFSGNVTGNYWTGGVVGYSMGGSIDNCSSSGYVNGGDQYTGGLVGHNYGELKYCFSTSSVNGTDRVGGAVGYNEAPAGVIEHCYSEGNVSGRDYLGGLVGNNEGGDVDHCEAHGSTDGRGFVGGLIGYNTGKVENSSSTGKVHGSSGGVGGFIGRNRFGYVTYCQSESNTTANGPYSGGFAGINELSTISNSFSKGHVVSTSDYVGGFAGRNQLGRITSCYSTGNASGSGDFVGGFIGSNDEGEVEDCYSTGNVSGDLGVGGFVGTNNVEHGGYISRSYSSGNIEGNSYLGGFCGSNLYTSFISCFFDNITSGMTSSPGGIGKNTTDMMLKTTFSNSGWDFNGVWEIVPTYTYPYLQNHSYNGPEIVTDHVFSAAEDSSYEVDFEAVSDYPGNNNFQWTLESTADWLSMSLDGTLSGTPENDDVGETTVKVICSLPTVGQTSSTFTLTVENTNDAPMITSTPEGNATEDLLYSIQFKASDIDPTGDMFTWSFETGPDWLSIDSDTGWLNGTPENDDVGTHVVNISVGDGNGGTDWMRFTITVENTNDDPVITTIPISIINEDSLFSTYFHADDIDPVSTSFMWSLDTDASWLSLTGNHLHGTPANSDVGSYWINVSVKDGDGGMDWINFTLTVINTNDDPIFTFTPITSATEDQLYSLRATAFDPDPTSDQLRYILKSGPEWLSMDTFTGWLNGTPENKDVGSHPINVSVNDGIGGHCYMEFIITVTNVNDAPQITTTTPPGTVDEDTPYSVFFQARDIDPVLTDLRWTMETDSTWLTLDGDHLHGIPTNDDVGIHRVNITVMDDVDAFDWIEFSIEVLNTNDDPYFTAGPPHFVEEDKEYNITLDAVDPDPTNDTLTWNLEQAPDFLSIDPETGRLFGTPTNEDVGVWEIIASVSDGNGGMGTLEFEIRVVNTNDDPIIITEPITEIEEDEEYFLRLVATDEDPGLNEIEWEMRTNATWLSLDGDILKGTPGDDDVGFFYVNITIDDGNGGYDNLYFIISVTNTNDPPRIISDPVAFATEDILYAMQFEVEDVDVDFGDSFQWTLSGPDWLGIDPDTGFINGTPTNEDVGLHWIEVTVSDLYLESDSRLFILDVQNTNDAPEWEIIPINTNMTEEDLLTMYASAEDPDGDTLTYSISSTPELAISIDTSSGMILCSIPQPGSYVVTATASDGIEIIETVFQINVSEVPEIVIPTEETDTDSDGMPDWWEDLYQLNPEEPSDAGEDPDGDSITNLEEFNGRTSPLKDNSEREDKGTNPVIFVIIAVLAILVLIFLVLFLLKGSGKGDEHHETEEVQEPSPEIPEADNETSGTERTDRNDPESE